MPTLIRQLKTLKLGVCLFLALTISAAAALSGEVNLRCRWLSPNDRRTMDLSFAGNPLVVMLPGESLQVAAEADGQPGRLAVIKDGKIIREDTVLNFTAPEKPGAFYISVAAVAGEQNRRGEICVLVPHKATARRSNQGWLVRVDETPIGEYRQASASGNAKVKDNPDSYQPPVWWMRITDMNASFEVSPGVKADDLVAPSEDTGTKHTDIVPVCYSMWTAITTLRNGLSARGIPGSALRVISGFRTPPYNRSIGSNAFGRHVYGDAFDFYINLAGGENIKAADLNRDGKLDRRDAYPIVAVIEDLQAEGKLPMGGIGVYNTIGGDHEVSLHLDVRGHRATWCYINGAGHRNEACWQSRHFSNLDREDEDKAVRRAAEEGRSYSRPHREPLNTLSGR